jgi:Domain of unknown function (DUF4129)
VRSGPFQLPPPEHGADEAREAADEVLSRPEFGEQKGLLQRFFEWLAELLDFDRAPSEPSTPGALDLGWLGSLIGWLVVLALLGLAVFLVVRFVRIRGHRRRPTGDEPAVAVEEEERSAAQWRGDAEALEAEGRWREAMLARYQGLVRELVESNVLAPIPGRTSGEYSDDVAVALPAAADRFDDATELFERAWYGDLPTGPDESSRFRDAAGRVLEEAAR